MGLNTNGYVLRAPRTAPSNATTTDEASNGVCEDFKSLPSDYTIPSPEYVNVASDQYRSAILLRDDPTTEYLLWAANTANLGTEASFTVTNEASASIPVGTLEVANTTTPAEPYTDGTTRLIITDDANRSILGLSEVIILRGDNNLQVDVSAAAFNPVTGVLDIADEPTLIADLGGGFSSTRGDRLQTIEYSLAPPTFWWTKNDRYELRFVWNGAVQRWEPLKGTPPRDLGVLISGGEFILSPAPVTTLGEYLPGDSAVADSYSMVRIGSRPDSSSLPVAEPAVGGFGGLLVVTDEEAGAEYDFAGNPTDAGVVGTTTGTIQWNPLFIDEFAGQTVFYSYLGFVQQDETEALGILETADLQPLFVSPIPGPTDYPFIRIGSRNALESFLVETDVALANQAVVEGQVAISLTTGRMKFSDADLAKTKPGDPTFDKSYLGAQAFFDGVSLSQRPITLRAPVALVDGSGNPTEIAGDAARYIPDAAPVPTGGTSGVMFVPDRTGTIPNTSSDPSIRPNPSGLRRDVRGPWDLVMFGEAGQFRTLKLVDDDDEIPKFAFRIPRGTAIVDLREGSGGSRVHLSKEDQQRFSGELLYFLQSGVQPSVWANQAQMFTRVRQEYTLVGDEVLVFRIGTNTFTWDAATDPGGVATSAGGTFTPADIATSLDAVITNTGSAAVVGDKVVLQGQSEANGVFFGEIEIGFGPGGEKDLSGPTALGFLPGWLLRVASPTAVSPPPDLRWLPDSGTNLGVFRSPLNLNARKDDISDINSIARFDDIVLQSQIPASPIVLLPRVPLEDVAGYDENVFFKIQDGFSQRFLQDYETAYYEFGLGKFSWATTSRIFGQIEQPTPSLLLGNPAVIPSSFQCVGKGLRVSEGGPFIEKEIGLDFDLLDGGASGIANLINSVGTSVILGGRGSFSSGSTTFTDPSADIDFVALGVKAGYQLEIQRGDAEGVYIVTADATVPNSLEVSPAFVDDGSNLPWEVFEGIDKDTFDPGIIADVVYTAFNHLPEEPFRIRQLSSVEDLPADAAAQTANRLFAYMADALSSGRIINMRFGLPNASPTSSLVGLAQTNLGRMANDTLVVPAVSSERFANGNFDIRVNTKTYTFANGDLIKVPVLSAILAGDVIEVQESDGKLNFGAEVLVQFEGSDAVYAEIFLDPDLSPVELPAGTTEYDPVTGQLNFSAADMAQYGGTTTYFVEQMITTNNQDVTINAIQGSFAFSKPLREFQIVEVDYFLANNGTGTLKLVENPDDPEAGPAPVRVIEFLPLFVREEVATATTTGEVPYWDFNPTERTTRADIETLVWIGGTLTNIGSSPVSTTEFDTNRINFEIPVADTEVVKINYAVLEAFGGEETYTTSQQPIYRPPFFIEAEKTSFELAEDRTADVLPGQLLRLGAAPFYLTGVTYDAALDITTVEFIPETTQEAGSRNAGDEAPALLSGIPIAKDYNPEAPNGFWQEVTAPFQPVNRGYVNIIFLGDFTQLAVTEHILEISGLPFVISGSSLSDDGTKTTIEVTAPFPRGFGFGFDTVRISVRPIYAIDSTAFLGRGGLFPGSTFDAVLFGETNAGAPLPGRVLRLSIDYEIDTDSGEIEFLNPPEGPIVPGETLYLRHIQVALLSPFIDNDVTIIPAFTASYTNVIIPSDENGIQNRILKATYTFANPDTFFYRSVPLLEYIGEVANDVARDIAARLPSQGPAAAVPPPTSNSTEGRLGLKAQLRDFQDQDRAGRVFLEFYNEVIVPFEQILETISGNIVGDRDGKFRFFIGRGKEVPPPGYEDAITGDLNERNAFTEVFSAFNAALVFLTRDPVVDPATAVLAGDQIEGDFPDSDLLGDLIDDQRTVIQNDVDDIVLIGRTRKRIASLIPFKLHAFGRYRRMGEPNRFSRIFPERTEAFTQLDPGIQSDLNATPVKKGVYSFRKRISRLSFKGGISLPKRASTFKKSIGQIENPVLGQIENVSSVDVVLRYPRARIFLYSDIGFPELDDEMAAAGYDTFTASPRPAVIATVLPFNEFPLADNGLPDLTQLIANGGDLPDLSTGDPTLFTPPWQTLADASRKPMVSFGRPDGRIIDVATAESFSYTFLGIDYTVTKKVFVGEVALGCVITFTDQDDSGAIGPGGVLELSEDPAATNPPIDLFQGDTIFVTPPDAQVASDVNAAPTQEEKQEYATGLPGFRVQFDLRIDRSDGEFQDNTWSSYDDPSLFGLKEIFGQDPPKPMDYIDADVKFRNGNINPAAIPALTGGYTNDSGDYTLPYLYAQNTEIDRLGQAASAFLNLVTPDTPLPSAVYPDEILGADGAILATFIGGNLPAVLLTTQDATPVTTAGAYAPHSGIGDVEQYDFLFVESGQAGIPNGSQGMLSVGSVTGGATGSVIEPPRFVTHSVLGDRLRYRLRTALSYVNQLAIPLPATPGMVISRPLTITRFNIASVSAGIVVFNDGSAGGLTGGLNNIINPAVPFDYATGNSNAITINVWTADTGGGSTYLQTVVLRGAGGAWTAQTQVPAPGALIPITVQPTADDNLLSVDTAVAIFTIVPAPGPGGLPEDPLNPGATLPLWFTVDVDTSSAAVVGDPAASTTGFIGTDRLTLDEGLDLRGILARDEPKPDIAGPDVFSELEVFWVEGGTTDALAVNEPAEVNGGSAFTFVRQSDFPPFAGGTFDPVVTGGTGRGTIKVPAFEGHGNTPIVTGDDITFTAIPSSSFDETGLISGGTGTAGITGVSPEMENFRILAPSVTIAKSLPGDILTITGSANATPKASSKNGTYLVKHAVEETVPGARDLALTTTTLPFNTGVGFTQVRFPVVTAFNVVATNRVTVDNVLLNDGVTSAFPPTGRLYVLTSFDQTLPHVGWLTNNYYMEYTAVDTVTGEFTVDPLTITTFGGAPGSVSASTLDGLAVGTTIAAGFTLMDIQFDKAPEEVLPRNLVGLATTPGVVTVGFTSLTFSNVNAALIAKTAAGGEILEAGGEINITPATSIPNGTFVDDENAYVYDSIPEHMELALPPGDWDTLHSPAPVGAILALMPGDTIAAFGGGFSGFSAQAGIFLEPTVPRSAQDLNGPDVQVVDDAHSLPAADLGYRPGFGDPATVPVTYSVRRIRRYHKQLEGVGAILEPLKFAYLIRRGTVTTFGDAPVSPNGDSYPYVITAAGGTQLGDFDSVDVNINPGDAFRLMDTDGKTLLDEVEIAAIEDGGTLALKAPGITKVSAADVVGKPFEIYLRTVPVPHEQSNEQLRSQITQEVILERTADYTTQEGGKVPTEPDPTDARRLKDTDLTINFDAVGVEVGDILLIDPAGLIQGPSGIPTTGQERGFRPFGDRSVPERQTAQPGQEVPFEGGAPSELDDNRGWYRVTEVLADAVVVSSETLFSNPIATGNVTFGSEAIYAVYPTISTSGAAFASPPGGGVEGQNDLRPTSFAGEFGSGSNSYKDNLFSVAPFSYQIFRPSALFSDEAIDTILMHRERIFSFLDVFGVFFRGDKYGNYFVFQRDNHISDLGNPTIPDEGLGVMSNALVEGAAGLFNISPYANASDALSVLGRRFWVNDFRLDGEFPPFQAGVPSYATLESNTNNPSAPNGDGRPVLPDLIDDVLNNNDQFRELRLAWLDFRVNREAGTLESAERFAKEIPKRRREELKQMRLAESVESIT